MTKSVTKQIVTIKGIVEFFNAEKGFGFIRCHNGKKVFVHFSDVTTVGHELLQVGEEVRFEVAKTEKGPRAMRVQVTPTSLGNTLPPPKTDLSCVSNGKSKKKKKSFRTQDRTIQTRSQIVGHNRAHLWTG